MKFFNREKEIKEILSIIESEPQRINFIFGSINSGKTALINEIINNRLDKDKYVVFYIDLREIFISKYDDFEAKLRATKTEGFRLIIEVLFEVYEESFIDRVKKLFLSLVRDSPDVVKNFMLLKISGGVIDGIPIPKNTLNELLKDKEVKNVFRYITNVLMEIKKEGKQPIIIIDELQKIGDLKLNGFLIYELFNYFVSLTKHKHLCHVFCLSSDSLFIERVYNEAMLKGRVDYILVDDFDKENALKFMDSLSEEILNKKLSDEDKELIYNYVGGKPIDIIYVIDKLKNKDLKEILETLLMNEQQKLKYFLKELDYIKPKVAIGDEVIEIKKEDIIKALKLFKDNYKISDDEIPEPVYIYLVKRNILFLNPIEGTLKPQSFLVWNAIKRII
ncbi:ATPase [Methanocaldococcus sp. FS406-22]|uniref:ATP-binding protein n=1 Tax=Methanocaldococcus sp. (strain FS406-22) TaxID=644281 RepID=UPI0001BF2482|nr:ATP-binding protein [Methanocaldococcus sp. FS406-22]ADC70017.1 ATPase [Methanocaldococcus sp. FS406-22]